MKKLKNLNDNRIFRMNLDFLIENYYKTQSEFSQKMDISPGTVSNLLNGINEPSVYLLKKIKEIHNISIDQMLLGDITKEDDQFYVKEINQSKQCIYDKYVGFYHCFYFNTNFKPKDITSSSHELKAGFLLLYKSESKPNYMKYYASALFGLNLEELDQYKNFATLPYDQVRQQFEQINNTGHTYVYDGSFDLMEDVVYVDLVNTEKEQISIILNSPKSNKTYIGGLGSILSMSRGGNSRPCSQLIGLSKGNVLVNEKEIADHLLLGDFEFPIENGREVLQKFFQFYLDAKEGMQLEEEEKEILVLQNIKRVLEKSAKTQYLKIAYLDAASEKAWYRLIKRFNNRNK